MFDTRISRRAALMGAGAVAAWMHNPARAMLWQAAALPVPAFIDALIAKMTLAEKAGQLTLMPSAWGGGVATALNPASNGPNFDGQLEEVRQGRLTGVFNGNGAEMARRMQTAAMTQSRLKIPLIFAADVIHGHRTIFPVPVGEAASFEPGLAERTARMAAYEAAASGIDWTFAPMVDIARDQRWGRTMEGAGEDVLLGRLIADARVRGFQGKDLKDNDAVLACAKHFAAYGAAEAGLDYNTVDISERTLREIYLPPFKAAVDAGVLSFMASFNEISGVPSTGNSWLMETVLRGEWGFKGFVVSDYTGDMEMIDHGFAADAREAAKLAFLAGVDMSMTSGFYRDHLPDLVEKGEVPVARLDASVRTVLAMKARLGLFEDPFRRIDLKREKARSRTKPALALAREAGRKSIVMIKNDGDLLPLPKSGKKIALIGPFASGSDSLNGPWVVYGDNAQAIDLATGVKAAVADRSLITVVQGSTVEAPLPGGIEAAVAAAREADIVVLAIGESEGMSGEAQSRAEIIVPEPQQALAEAVAAVGKPVVIVLKNGRALALKGAVVNAPSILVTWFLGSESGHAIADILFGDYSPSGRLPCSFPRSLGQQPYSYAHKPTGRPNPSETQLEPYKAHYRGIPNSALFPFGHGLTYGKFEYSDLSVAPTLAWDGELTVSAKVTNTGKRAAEELVQLYTHDRAASVTRPVRELKAFRKVTLAPGASEVVTFKIRRDLLLFIGRENKPTVEPGLFDVWVSPSAETQGVRGSFELKGA
ncbi:glycoside hydrolase family 3 C-terminal domain-containing protein [Sphingomonas sp. JC676]|uniref:glycoside hydrolase family 3 N-terminal domain-containing protein n=1 Tax=Sphingomonas sp. JC676 TaxID=2768065 RepID=UPI001657B9BB|nr:glycoside hydrolase family 3 N-terminal domain-containing protein [Sphingomonas sp. JC676]MBC9032275.1 glycoside hydrolase family 3 C-terminal domain-containing protein [Sphingomonas sp. JC676]